ncbi:hypothetical protein [Streptomyces sp. ST2-7A]|uniref:hypothetical protein n=1 Tax=Streptomyces sp. ST2-7A TaxID=2907214 RepID=UPI001F1E29AA|nr:hypothetical protein [Streptomyces sp. ST2-7A]MCE7081717.1 hypothetical protein [Streptomyces sp. ST2-7A]
MVHRIRRRVKETTGLRRPLPRPARGSGGAVPPEDTPTEPAPRSEEPMPMVDDFPPPELRIPGPAQLGGRMMPWPWPLVLDQQVVTCAGCGAYRDWLVLSTDDRIQLRCRAGHQQHEERLDTAWYNRHAGPADVTHATFEDCLRHLGH